MPEELWKKFLDSLWGFFSGQGKAIAWAIAILVVGLLIISIVTKTVRKNSTKSRKIDNHNDRTQYP